MRCARLGDLGRGFHHRLQGGYSRSLPLPTDTIAQIRLVPLFEFFDIRLEALGDFFGQLNQGFDDQIAAKSVWAFEALSFDPQSFSAVAHERNADGHVPPEGGHIDFCPIDGFGQGDWKFQFDIVAVDLHGVMRLHLDREDQVAVGITAYWISESAQTDLFSGCNIARDLDAEVLGSPIPTIEFELDLSPFDHDTQRDGNFGGDIAR